MSSAAPNRYCTDVRVYLDTVVLSLTYPPVLQEQRHGH